MIAKKAEIKDYKLKVLIWGKPGVGKSRWALNSDKPLVLDFENSTTLYSNEFDFYRAVIDQSTAVKSKKDKSVKDISNATLLTKEIISEISNGVYKGIVNTLIIDSATDLLDNIESILLTQYENKIGKNLMQLNQLQKSKWYKFRRENTRRLLDKIIALDVNIIFTARSKIVWGTGQDGKTQPVGTQVDALEILESLVDVVIELTENKEINITKTRLSKSEGIIEGIKTFNDFKQFVLNDKIDNKNDEIESAKKDAGKGNQSNESIEQNEPISKEQISEIKKLQKEIPILDSSVKAVLKDMFKIEKIEELNTKQYELFINRMKKQLEKKGEKNE
jgi:hypothetical protein